ncbi:hypothetical protein [Isoptericola sp. BMS4]|uniref:hypothetical protein n=1 Tax=Isoptericola sp. BMS4 TaxID=2527875 RepID=UPI0014214F0F|nr:hypothetical protein [Isoptericola sp. BMS4]
MIADGLVIVEALKGVALLPLTLSGIPGVDSVHDRVTALRLLAFTKDRACLFSLDAVLWDVERPRFDVVRRGLLVSRVTISGHEVTMHSQCAADIARLWAGEPG